MKNGPLLFQNHTCYWTSLGFRVRDAGSALQAQEKTDVSLPGCRPKDTAHILPNQVSGWDPQGGIYHRS